MKMSQPVAPTFSRYVSEPVAADMIGVSAPALRALGEALRPIVIRNLRLYRSIDLLAYRAGRA